ncbi:MAG: hypothetical protein M3R58_14290 [Pseudomonadota bacterium]|nr:hypothetical protein [Pseudomonadota bacterium]
MNNSTDSRARLRAILVAPDLVLGGVGEKVADPGYLEGRGVRVWSAGLRARLTQASEYDAATRICLQGP